MKKSKTISKTPVSKKVVSKVSKLPKGLTLSQLADELKVQKATILYTAKKLHINFLKKANGATRSENFFDMDQVKLLKAQITPPLNTTKFVPIISLAKKEKVSTFCLLGACKRMKVAIQIMRTDRAARPVRVISKQMIKQVLKGL